PIPGLNPLKRIYHLRNKDSSLYNHFLFQFIIFCFFFEVFCVPLDDVMISGDLLQKHCTFVTTLPAPMTVPSPIVTPGSFE
ncbi:MAG: hypothetical protein Q4E51_10300, partial [Lachnospiraceae bacterium]|nr:hypothetical protein [Lachnospiraceae bacterium]